MTAPALSPAQSNSRPSLLQYLLMALVAILTVAMAYPWGYSLITWMLVGVPRWDMFAVFATTLGLLMVLSAVMASIPSLRAYLWPIGLGSAVLFGFANGVILYLRIASTPPLTLIIPMYVIGSMWVIWLGLFFFWPLRFTIRSAILVLLVGVMASFISLFKVEGLTGDANVDLVWRSRAPKPVALPTAIESRGAEESVALAVEPNDFPQYLGPNRDGRLMGPDLARDWESSPPKEIWRRPVGAGWGGFAVVGAFAITQEQRGTQESVVCYDRKTGKERWIHGDPILFDSSLGGPGPRATPTVHDGLIYTMGATGRLNCLDASGKLVWAADTLSSTATHTITASESEQKEKVASPAAEGPPDPAAENISHGMCGSPLVIADRVYVTPCGPDGKSLAAFDAKTGELIFREGQHRASYSSPLFTSIDGKPQILVFNSLSLAGHDPDSGKVLWSFDWTNDVNVNCSQPIVPDADRSEVFVSTGYGTGATLLDVQSSAELPWTVKPTWKNRSLKAKFATPILKDGYIYGLDDGIMVCVELKSGKQMWKRGRYGHGQILLAGDLLLVQTEKGPIVLIDPQPEKLIELGSIPALSDKTWNTLALAGPYLFARNSVEAVCYELPLVDRSKTPSVDLSPEQ